MSNAGKGTLISAAVVLIAGAGIGVLVGGKSESATVTKTVATTITTAPTTTSTDPTTTEQTTTIAGEGTYMSDDLDNENIVCGGDLGEPTWGEARKIGRETFNYAVSFYVSLDETGKTEGNCSVPGDVSSFSSKVGFFTPSGDSSDYSAKLKILKDTNRGETLWSGTLTGSGSPKPVDIKVDNVNQLIFVLTWTPSDVDTPTPDLIFGDPVFG